MKEKLNGLDLFSGIAGNSLALGEWVNTVAYCEGDRHAQAVLLSRMREGIIPSRPIWDDVTTLQGGLLPGIDIIIGGFPCQDISVAGKGAGLSGERSGLFFEIVRLAKEIKPSFLFLENVPAIRTRGLDVVIQELTSIGYDLRWTMLSARDVGASHKRERWFCLAYSTNKRCDRETPKPFTSPREPKCPITTKGDVKARSLARQAGGRERPSESSIRRVTDGIPQRLDRIKRLGNAVVPLQAREAFKALMGITEEEIASRKGTLDECPHNECDSVCEIN